MLSLSLLPPQPPAMAAAIPTASTIGSSRAIRAILRLKLSPDTSAPLDCSNEADLRTVGGARPAGCTPSSEPEAAYSLLVPAKVVGELVAQGPLNLAGKQLRVVPEVAF